jgi:hypothetical protein
MPDLSDSSRMSLMPSIFFSLTSSAMRSSSRSLVHLVGQLVDDDGLAVATPMSSKCVRARITTRPRPVR